MRITSLCVVLALSGAVCAQDVVVLENGDRITGTLVTAAEGVVTFKSTILGDLQIPLTAIADLQTAGAVELVSGAGERVMRQITSISDGALQLAGGGEGAPAAPSMSLQALAKINPPAREPAKWTGSLSVGGLIAMGNTERRSISSNADLVRRGETDRISFNAGWNYSEDKTGPGNWNLTERRAAAGLKYDYFLGEKSYLYAATSAMGDTQANIDLRYTAGGGYGFQWVERDDLSVATEIGLGYFVESYRDNTPSAEYLSGRAAVKAMWQAMEGIKLFDDLEVFPSVEDGADFYLTNALYTRMALTDSMFAEPRWEIDYDNTPSAGLERLDHRFFLSVGWTF